MPMFRKKSVELEARMVPIYYEGISIDKYLNACIDFAEWCGGTSHMMYDKNQLNHIRIGDNRVAYPGDWVLKDNNEFRPFASNSFKDLFEEINPTN